MAVVDPPSLMQAATLVAVVDPPSLMHAATLASHVSNSMTRL